MVRKARSVTKRSPLSSLGTIPYRAVMKSALGKPTYLVFILLFAALTYVALHRFVAVDEGFYLLAGKLVAEGQHPYLDFFYPQMPLLPYIHAAWILLFEPSWTSARIFTALCSALIGTLLFRHLNMTRGFRWGLLGVALFLGSGLTIGWFTVAKTYCFAGLPLMVSFSLLSSRRRDSFTLLLCGLSLGLAIDIRLFYLALVPIFLVYARYVYLLSTKQMMWCIVGGLLATLPHLFFILGDFESYWFNNFDYHMLRSHRPPGVDSWSRWNIVWIITGIKQTARLDGFQFPALLWANIGVFFLCSILSRVWPPLSVVIGLTLSLLYLTPNPIHLQYFVTVVPYLIMGAVGMLQSFHHLSHTGGKFSILASAALLISTLAVTPNAYLRFTQTGEGVKGIDAISKEVFTLENVQAVSKRLDHHFAEGATVLSQWPGFLFETKLKQARGLENQFWIRVATKMSDEDREKFQLMGSDKLKKLVRDPTIQGVVIEQRKAKRYLSLKVLDEEGFVLAEKLGDVMIYKRTAR